MDFSRYENLRTLVRAATPKGSKKYNVEIKERPQA